MLYIKPENRDTRYPLWFERYECRVPHIQTKSVEDLSENGMPTSGDKYHDHATYWEPRLLALPIVRMAELWNEGANVALVRRSDAPKIYEDITAHLHAWKEHMVNAYHVVKPPYDDLLILDQFANIVYEHAKFAYDTKFVSKFFKLSSNTAIGRRAMLNAISRVEDRRREDEEKGILRVRNIDYRDTPTVYNPDAVSEFVDYSGKEEQISVPPRASLASFFKKGQK